MNTSEIFTSAENEEDTGRTVWAWGFTLNGEDFGGYCASEAEARSDAERILELKLDELEANEIDRAYADLVGYAPISADGMSEESGRELLFERMCES